MKMKLFMVLGLVSALSAQDPATYPTNYAPPDDKSSLHGYDQLQNDSKEITNGKVSEFTGSLDFRNSLGSIGNQNGLRYPIELRYASGDAGKANSSWKYYFPTTWVGLGFDLPAPYIEVVNKSIKGLWNDVYLLHLPGIANCELIEGAGNIFSCKTNPKVKATRIEVGSNHDEIDYWTVVLESGQVYRFGSESSSGTASQCANFYEQCKLSLKHRIGSFPGCSRTVSAPSQLGKTAVKWFLRQIDDRLGAFHINFEYQLDGNTTYLERIHSDNGGSVQEAVFQISNKGEAENSCPDE
jgi:hypothetical protein